MSEFTLIKESHFFKCINVTPRARIAIESYARTLVQTGWVRERNKYFKAPIKVFAMATADRTEFRFHINQLTPFKNHIAALGLTNDLYLEEHKSIHKSLKVKLKIRPEWVLRDYQVPVVDYLVSDEAPVAKFVNLPTGQGKGMCTLYAMSLIGLRTLIVVKPMYLTKWVEEIEEKYDVQPEDTIVIRGSSQLLSLLLSAQDNDCVAKIILISSKTIANWISLYEKYKDQSLDMGYPVIPEDLCKILKVGVLVMDEVHQEFFANYKFFLNTNVYRSISLSATLISDDEFISKMYGVCYPITSQYHGAVFKKYIAATAVFYRFNEPGKIRCKDYVTNNYSHHMFEQSILRNKLIKENYLSLIKDIFAGTYVENYKEGQKCLIFCISIDLCVVVRDYLQRHYPKLDIRKYTQEDPWVNLMEADVSVSTMQSSGTAVDIPGLSTVIMSTALNSLQGNVQGMGRLRELKDGSTPRFIYLVCEDIDTHIRYHVKKREILETKALHYNSIFIGKPL